MTGNFWTFLTFLVKKTKKTKLSNISEPKEKQWICMDVRKHLIGGNKQKLKINRIVWYGSSVYLTAWKHCVHSASGTLLLLQPLPPPVEGAAHSLEWQHPGSRVRYQTSTQSHSGSFKSSWAALLPPHGYGRYCTICSGRGHWTKLCNNTNKP